MNDFLSINDLSKDEFDNLLNLALEMKRQYKCYKKSLKVLEAKTLAMIFYKASTRTRISFNVAMNQLGGDAIFITPTDSQIGRGEPLRDTAGVLTRYVDGVMIRTHKHEDIVDFAKFSEVPVINGLTDLLHPCQVMADIMTVYEKKNKLQGIKLAYIGDGNNMANSYLHGISKAGMDIAIATPSENSCNLQCIDNAKENAKKSGSKILITNDPFEAVKDADVICTDTWVSMGMEKEKENKINQLMNYQVNEILFKKAKTDAIFMHCLPAYRGYEVTSEVIDGPKSVIYDEAENRLHIQKAILTILMAE